MKRSLVCLLIVLGLFSPLFVACTEQEDVTEEQPLESTDEAPLEEGTPEEAPLEEGTEEAVEQEEAE